ncbi:MAG: type IV pilus modification PilV family protein, partial [Gammaproteobacteria bacterium]
MTNLRKTQRGVGLVEALIAALVFAVGIGALIKLQGTYFLSGSNANARAAASAMAQAKLDELRALDFPNIAAGNDNPTPASGTAFTYARNWTLTNYYYNSAGTLTVCTTPADCDAGQAGVQSIDQKLLTVTVSWNDPDPNNDTVVVSSVINKTPDSSSSSMVGFTPGGSGEKPVRIHNPGLLPDVVPIDINTSGVKKETSKPAPDVSSNLNFTETYFEVTSYGIGNQLVRSEEFLTVNCACSQDPQSSDHGVSPARLALQTDANGNKFLDYIKGEEVAGKPTGTRIATGQLGQQSELCNECCRDHHDPAT